VAGYHRYPTDLSLLGDGYRTLARLMKSVRGEITEAGLNHRPEIMFNQNEASRFFADENI
jgi:hypothetical protein